MGSNRFAGMERPWRTPARLHQFLLHYYVIRFLFIHTVYGAIEVDNSTSEIAVFAGEPVTLVCDLRNVDDTDIYWYVSGRGEDIAKNYEIIEEQYADRYSVTGSESHEEYNLYIDNVQVDDAGIYRCVYYTLLGLNRETLVITELIVLSPPSRDSPTCSVFPTVGSSLDFLPGDTVLLQCDTKDGSPPPSLSWFHNELLLESGSGTLQTLVELKPEHYNEPFLCLMKTRALLNETRSCSETPLRRSTTTSTNSVSTTVHEDSSKLSGAYQPKVTTIDKHTHVTEIRTDSVMKQQNIIIIGSAAGAAVFLLMIFIIIIIIVMCCCKKGKQIVMNKPVDRPATDGYEMVIPQEPLDHSTNRTTPSGSEERTDEPSGNHGNRDVDEEEQLVYADLQLNEPGDDIIQTDDATIYAKVKV